MSNVRQSLRFVLVGFFVVILLPFWYQLHPFLLSGQHFQSVPVRKSIWRLLKSVSILFYHQIKLSTNDYHHRCDIVPLLQCKQNPILDSLYDHHSFSMWSDKTVQQFTTCFLYWFWKSKQNILIYIMWDNFLTKTNNSIQWILF